MGVNFFQNGVSLGASAGWGGYTGSNNYVVRYDFTTPAAGASAMTLTLSGIYYGHNAGTQGFGFRIGTSPTAWANARGETPDSTLGYMSYSAAAGYGCTMTAAGLNLRAYTTYYIFVYAATGGAEYYTGWNCTTPAITGTPEALYFWFTSSVSTAAYGSNQIYHYATGNWNAALGTGTRTPAIYGGLSGGTGGGSGGGGAVGVDRFTVKDCGTRLNMPQLPWSGSMSMSVGEIGRMCVSFDFSVQTDIIVTSSGGAATLTRLYVSTDPNIDETTGHPVSTVLQFEADGTLSAARFERGRTYYLFAIFGGGKRGQKVLTGLF